MGVINVTPDSFSDGGQFLNTETAIAQGHEMVRQGAAILDIGGESTRPGAAPVPQEEELARVIPVLEGLKDCGARLSIDTAKSEVMRRAVEAGAGIINDVTALRGDPDSLDVAAQTEAEICLMHMRGTPQTMQKNPEYDDVVTEVFDFLATRIAACEKAGIGKDRIIADPGIGFGKTLEHNLALLRNLERFGDLGVRILLGASRKSFIARLSPETGQDPRDRLPGSLAAALCGASKGADILRVHDVAATRQALDVWAVLRA